MSILGSSGGNAPCPAILCLEEVRQLVECLKDDQYFPSRSQAPAASSLGMTQEGMTQDRLPPRFLRFYALTISGRFCLL